MAYEKQNFYNGQVLKDEHLNNMEKGITEAVSYTAQSLTDDQKAQARGNIGAVKSWDELEDKPFGYGDEVVVAERENALFLNVDFPVYGLPYDEQFNEDLDNLLFLNLNVGDSVTVLWNEQTYLCDVVSFDGMPVLGNNALFTNIDTGEPFSFFPAQTMGVEIEGAWLALDIASTIGGVTGNTINSFSIKKKPVKTIEEKFVPAANWSNIKENPFNGLKSVIASYEWDGNTEGMEPSLVYETSNSAIRFYKVYETEIYNTEAAIADATLFVSTGVEKTTELRQVNGNNGGILYLCDSYDGGFDSITDCMAIIVSADSIVFNVGSGDFTLERGTYFYQEERDGVFTHLASLKVYTCAVEVVNPYLKGNILVKRLRYIPNSAKPWSEVQVYPDTIGRLNIMGGYGNRTIPAIPLKVSGTQYTDKLYTPGQILVIKAVDDLSMPTEWEMVDPFVIASSTSGSTKKFKLTVDDTGTISATEVV